MNLSDLLPFSGVPRSGGPEKREEKWSGQDNLEYYRKRGGHPLCGVDDIRYRYNARGYRCPEFDEEAEVRIISIGCSWVFGAGLPQEAIFHEHFARRLRLELGATVVNHPGAQTHELIGNLFWQRFVETGGLESLR
jgi:hypothetical protein